MATILIHHDAASAESATAKRLLDLIISKPDATLGLATGGTMEQVYAKLIERAKEKKVSFAGLKSFNLDEYIGLKPDHPQSYRTTMNKLLFDHIDIKPENTHLPKGDAADPAEEAKRYDAMISDQGGIDLQLLGIGLNGHIGFNEPSSSLGSRTRIKKLASSTMEANHRFFKADETVPTHALTMGIATIMQARKVILLATGASKADAIAQALEGPVSTTCPASVLQFHPDVTVIVDEDAASKLKLRDFYESIHPGGEEVYFVK